MPQSFTLSLAEILKKQVLLYLKKDNNPQNFFEKFFSSSGLTGKKRAEWYLTEVLNVMDGAELLTTVHKDINGIARVDLLTGKKEKWLGSSTKLRRRLMEGLCQFFNEDLRVREEASVSYKIACQAVAYGAPMPDPDFVKDAIMLRVINDHMQGIPEYQHENLTTLAYTDQKL